MICVVVVALFFLLFGVRGQYFEVLEIYLCSIFMLQSVKRQGRRYISRDMICISDRYVLQEDLCITRHLQSILML